MRIDRSSGRALATGMAMLMLAAAPLAAQQGDTRAGERTIRVSGSGTARAQPDLAQISFAVETTGTTAQAAARENATLMDRVVSALVAAGVARTDIETRGYSLYPTYAQQERVTEPQITGYRASNQVVLRTSELARTGEFIDIALSAGANRMNGINFELQDRSAAEHEALRDAVSRARASAEVIAASMGVRLGAVLDASTISMAPRPMPQFDMAAARMQSMPVTGTPVEPGQQVVHAQVHLMFTIVD